MNGKEEIWDAVENFRRQYLVGPLAQLPVDVFTLAELELKLDILPNWFTNSAMRHAFADRARPVFEVNTQVIEARLDREGIWPES